MTLGILVVFEAFLAAWLVTRVLRYRVLPSPTLRAAVLTAASLLAAMLSVTEPVEVLLRGPGAGLVWVPTLLKHLGLLGCGAGVLLMGLAQRPSPRVRTEIGVWAWFAVSAVAVTVLHIVAGGGGQRVSVDYVEWSHGEPLVQVAMALSYVGGLLASLGLFAVVWPLRVDSPTGRGLVIVAVGAAFAAGWSLMRIDYLRQTIWGKSPPADGDFLVTQLVSLAAIGLLTIGLLWSTVEADVRALRFWRDFRELHNALLAEVSAARRHSDYRLGIDAWVDDRAVEALDARHQWARHGGAGSGFPEAPANVGRSEVSAVVSRMGRRYKRGQS